MDLVPQRGRQRPTPDGIGGVLKVWGGGEGKMGLRAEKFKGAEHRSRLQGWIVDMPIWGETNLV